MGDSDDDMLLSDVDSGRHKPILTIPNGNDFIIETVSSKLQPCRSCSPQIMIRSPGNIELVASAAPPGIRPRTTIKTFSGSNGEYNRDHADQDLSKQIFGNWLVDVNNSFNPQMMLHKTYSCVFGGSI